MVARASRFRLLSGNCRCLGILEAGPYDCGKSLRRDRGGGHEPCAHVSRSRHELRVAHCSGGERPASADAGVQGQDRQDLQGLGRRFSAAPQGPQRRAQCRRHPARRCRLRPSGHIWRTDPDAQPRQTCERRPPLQHLPHHRHLFADARGGADRPQSSSGRLRHHSRTLDRLSRLRQRLAARSHDGGRGAEGKRLQHGGLGQVAQYTRLGDDADRPVHALADRRGL